MAIVCLAGLHARVCRISQSHPGILPHTSQTRAAGSSTDDLEKQKGQPRSELTPKSWTVSSLKVEGLGPVLNRAQAF